MQEYLKVIKTNSQNYFLLSIKKDDGTSRTAVIQVTKDTELQIANDEPLCFKTPAEALNKLKYYTPVTINDQGFTFKLDGFCIDNLRVTLRSNL